MKPALVKGLASFVSGISGTRLTVSRGLYVKKHGQKHVFRNIKVLIIRFFYKKFKKKLKKRSVKNGS